jgi:hypothetical protein
MMVPGSRLRRSASIPLPCPYPFQRAIDQKEEYPLDLDAPVQLVRCVVADLLSDRRNFSAAVRNYLDLRSTARGAGAIPTRSIFEVVPDATSTQVKLQNFFEIPIYQTGKTYPMIETGGVAARESCYLVMLLGTTKAKTIIEFGTSYGDTTLLLALNSPPDAVVLTTDLPEWSAVGIKFMEPDANQKCNAAMQEPRTGIYRRIGVLRTSFSSTRVTRMTTSSQTPAKP